MKIGRRTPRRMKEYAMHVLIPREREFLCHVLSAGVLIRRFQKFQALCLNSTPTEKSIATRTPFIRLWFLPAFDYPINFHILQVQPRQTLDVGIRVTERALEIKFCRGERNSCQSKCNPSVWIMRTGKLMQRRRFVRDPSDQPVGVPPSL